MADQMGMRFALISLLTFAIAGLSSASDIFESMGASTRQVIEKHLREQRVLNESHPELTRSLSKIFERVSEAQRRNFPSNAVVRNHVVIVQSNVMNAYVMPVMDFALNRLENTVVISSRMLAEIYSAEATGQKAGEYKAISKEAEAIVANLLGHELRHPMVPGTHIEDIRKRFLDRQILEVDADLGGMKLAEEAGYSRRGMIRLMDLLKRDPERLGALSAFASTHPTAAIRQSLARLYKSSRRHQRGSDPTPPELATNHSAWKELQGIRADIQAEARARSISPTSRAGTIDWTYKEPKSLEEIRDRLIELRKRVTQDGKEIRPDWFRLEHRFNYQTNQREPVRLPWAGVEYNRLLLSMNRLLKGSEATVWKRPPHVDWTVMEGILREIAALPAPFDQHEFGVMVSGDYGAQAFAGDPSWEQSLRRNPIYQSTEYVELLKQKHIDEVPFGTRHATLGESSELALRFHPPNSARFAKLSAPPQYYVLEDSESLPRSRLSSAGRLDIMERHLEHFLGKDGSGPVAFDRLIHREKGAFTLAPYFSNENLNILESEDFKALPQAEQEQVRQRFRKIVSKLVYVYSGKIGLAELMTDGRVPWDKLFALLNLTPEEGKRIIERNAIAYARSPHWTEFVEKKISTTWDPYRASQTRKPTSWVTPQVVSGLKHPNLEQQVVLANPELQRQYFREQVAQALITQRDTFQSGDRARIKAAIQETEATFNSRWKVSMQTSSDLSLAEIWLDAVNNSPTLSAEAKAASLRTLFLPTHPTQPFRVVDAPISNLLTVIPEREGLGPRRSLSETFLKKSEVRERLAEKLKSSGVTPSWSAYILEQGRLLHARGSHQDSWQNLASLASDTDQHIATELEAMASSRTLSDAAKRSQLVQLARGVFNPTAGQSLRRASRGKRTEGNPDTFHLSPSNPETRRKVIELAERLELGFEEREILFQHLLAHKKAAGDTDRLLEPALRDLLSKPLSVESRDRLTRLLENKLIWTDRLGVDIARKLLEPELASLAAHPPAPAAKAEAILNRLKRWLPSSSLELNDFLESIAGRLQLKGETLALLEAMKFDRSSGRNPMLVRMGSAVGQIVARFDDPARHDFIDWLAAGRERPLPQTVKNSLSRQLHQELSTTVRADRVGDIQQAIAERMQPVQVELEALARNLRPEERLPLIEFALVEGRAPLHESATDLDRILKRTLKIDPQGAEGKFIKILLQKLPPDERAAHLAYILTHASGRGLEVARIYEGLGPFGIRLAQMVSRWDLLGPEHSKKIQHLRDRAEKLSLKTIEDLVQARPDMDRLIDHVVEVKNCGTNRCAVLVQLKNKSLAMLMVQRPFAADVIDGTFDLARDIVLEAKRQNLHPNLGLMDVLLKDLKPQMLSELDGIKEVETIGKVQAHVARLNADPEMRKALGQLQLEVPGPVKGAPVYPEMFLMEYFEGVPFEASPGKAEVGRAIVLANQKMRYEYGVGDADRHRGQYLVNPSRNAVAILDTAGWWYEFSPQDQKNWLSFIRTLATGDASQIVQAAQSLSDTPGQLVAKDKLIAELSKELKSARPDLRERALAIVRCLENQGLEIAPRFKYGGIMEWMTQRSEGFMPVAEYDELVKSVVTKSVMRQMGLGVSPRAPAATPGLNIPCPQRWLKVL